MKTAYTLLHDHHTHRPERVCLHLLAPNQPDRPVTYRELMELAAGYAQLYEQSGIRPGEVVILILQHGLDLIGAFWGGVLHGAIPSIMPFLTEKLLPERYRKDLASLIEVTRPAAIVTYPEFEGEVRGAIREGSSVRRVLLSSQAAPAASPNFSQMGGRLRGEDEIVFLQHSSGTTGLQKGVAITHRALLNQLAAYGQAIRLTPEDVIVSWLPLYHDMGLIAGFLMPILQGVPLVLMSPFDWVKAPYRLMHAVTKYRGTLSWLPNFAYNFCAQKIRDAQLQGVDLSSWRAVINCSEPMFYRSFRLFAERFAPYGFRPEALATSYAMAENVFGVTQGGIDGPVTVDEVDVIALQEEGAAQPAASVARPATGAARPAASVARPAASVARPAASVARPATGAARPAAGAAGPATGAAQPAADAANSATQSRPSVKMLSCGRPIPGTRVMVVDADHRELPERRVGELVVQSNCMLAGYYNRPDATAQAFIGGDPSRGYLTGDYGYIADGEVYVTGRKKDLIIVGGRNVFPQDIEAAASEVPGVHPGRVAAFGLFNEDLGTEDVALVAEIDTPGDEQARQRIEDEIRIAVNKGTAVSLKYVLLVGPQWMVKTSSGKTARSANREKFLAEMGKAVNH